MNLSKPMTTLIPTLEGEVLTVLAGASTDFSGLQVQKIIGKYSPRGVRDALQRLAATGVVDRKPAGASDLYSLNTQHLLAKYIKSICNLRTEFIESLKQEVAAWQILPECAALFGSAIRKDMSAESDVDIFVVRPDSIDFGFPIWRSQLADISSKVEKWTGNSVQIFELGQGDISRELDSKNGVVYSIMEQGVMFYGPSDYLRKLPHKYGKNLNV
jgi:predicted nucleotidyltransferase